MMEFSPEQVRQLKAKLKARHVKTRQAEGTLLHYVEGWHTIAEANRIFGFDAWDRRTISSKCVQSERNGRIHFAAYVAKVRVSVRAGDITIIREGSGMGEGASSTPGKAHELALKGAETDGTKRALATFGNPFGLALYDREHAGVGKPRCEKAHVSEAQEHGPWVLRSATGSPQVTLEKPEAFAEELRKALNNAKDIEALFAVWEQNVETVRAINRHVRSRAPVSRALAQDLVAHLKACAVSLARPEEKSDASRAAPSALSNGHCASSPPHLKVDKSALKFGEPKRIRSKEHLRFVAQQPCLICGRKPSQAHHVRFAQQRGLGLKVSDEFTVPLCATHHSENHRTGDERRWWQEHKIDPHKVARDLWEASSGTKRIVG
jgi:recombination DNA repair RAD52 pathway protein